jgi:hypothetical protein
LGLSGCWEPPWIPRFTVGVFCSLALVGQGPDRDEKDALASVRGADVGSAYACPPAVVVPEVGQVREYGSKRPHRGHIIGVSQTLRAGFQVAKGVGSGAGGEDAADILDDDQSWSQAGDGGGDKLPEAGAGAGGEPGARAGDRQALAGKSGGDHIHRLNVAPVDGLYITVIDDVGPVPGEHADSVMIILCVPGDPAAKHALYAKVQASHTRKQRPDPQVTGVHDGPRCGRCGS